MTSADRHMARVKPTVLLLVLACMLTLGCALTLGACSGADPDTEPGPGTSAETGHAIAAPRGTLLEPGLPFYVDLDADDVLERVLVDSRGRLTITDGSIIYQSREKWRILTARLGDTDGNGLIEVVALVDSEKGRHLALWGAAPVGDGYEYRERLVTSPVVPRPADLDIVPREPLSDSALAGNGDLVVLTTEEPGPEGSPRQIVYRWNGFSFTVVEAVE